MREIAQAANVKPNTFVRMARQIGYDSYEDFRASFGEAIRKGMVSFPDCARWLQGIRRSGEMGKLYAEMVHSALCNIEETFAGIDADRLQKTAEAIWAARRVYTLGVGVNNSNARNFNYLASTGMVDFHATPRPGSTAIDDLAWADDRDIPIAITCDPYRQEAVETVTLARQQGLTVVGLSDSPASLIVLSAVQITTLVSLRIHRNSSRHIAILPVIGLDHRFARNPAILCDCVCKRRSG